MYLWVVTPCRWLEHVGGWLSRQLQGNCCNMSMLACQTHEKQILLLLHKVSTGRVRVMLAAAVAPTAASTVAVVVAVAKASVHMGRRGRLRWLEPWH